MPPSPSNKECLRRSDVNRATNRHFGIPPPPAPRAKRLATPPSSDQFHFVLHVELVANEMSYSHKGASPISENRKYWETIRLHFCLLQVNRL